MKRIPLLLALAAALMLCTLPALARGEDCDLFISMLFSGELDDMLSYEDGYEGAELDWPYNVYAAARASDSFNLTLPSEAELEARIARAERENGYTMAEWHELIMDYQFRYYSHSIPLYSDLMRRIHPSAADTAMRGVMSGSSLSVSGGELTGIDHSLSCATYGSGEGYGYDVLEIADSSIDTIGWGAFSYLETYEYSHLRLPDQVRTIAGGAFTCTNVMNIELPAGLTTIEAGAFWDCGIAQIEIPRGVTRLESDTFYDCDYLSHIIIPRECEYIAPDFIEYSSGDFETEDWERLVIYGWPGSAAEHFAQANDLPFVAIRREFDPLDADSAGGALAGDAHQPAAPDASHPTYRPAGAPDSVPGEDAQSTHDATSQPHPTYPGKGGSEAHPTYRPGGLFADGATLPPQPIEIPTLSLSISSSGVYHTISPEDDSASIAVPVYVTVSNNCSQVASNAEVTLGSGSESLLHVTSAPDSIAWTRDDGGDLCFHLGNMVPGQSYDIELAYYVDGWEATFDDLTYQPMEESWFDVNALTCCGDVIRSSASYVKSLRVLWPLAARRMYVELPDEYATLNSALGDQDNWNVHSTYMCWYYLNADIHSKALLLYVLENGDIQQLGDEWYDTFFEIVFGKAYTYPFGSSIRMRMSNFFAIYRDNLGYGSSLEDMAKCEAAACYTLMHEMGHALDNTFYLANVKLASMHLPSIADEADDYLDAYVRGWGKEHNLSQSEIDGLLDYILPHGLFDLLPGGDDARTVELAKEINADTRALMCYIQYTTLSDVLLCGNTVHSDGRVGLKGCYGHTSPNYWNSSRQRSEFWADYFAFRVMNDEMWFDLMSGATPNTLDECDAYFRRIADAIAGTGIDDYLLWHDLP